MKTRKTESPITDLLRKTIAESGVPNLVLHQQTGVARGSIIRFVRGDTSLRLDCADKLAEYFGLELVAQSRQKRGNAKPRHGRKGKMP
jgi:plasmid maintenance system antidote protein VapI